MGPILLISGVVDECTSYLVHPLLIVKSTDPSPLQVDHLPVGPRPRVLDPRLRDDPDRGHPPQRPVAGRHLVWVI